MGEGGELGELYCCNLRDGWINAHVISKGQETIGRK